MWIQHGGTKVYFSESFLAFSIGIADTRWDDMWEEKAGVKGSIVDFFLNILLSNLFIFKPNSHISGKIFKNLKIFNSI